MTHCAAKTSDSRTPFKSTLKNLSVGVTGRSICQKVCAFLPLTSFLTLLVTFVIITGDD